MPTTRDELPQVDHNLSVIHPQTKTISGSNMRRLASVALAGLLAGCGAGGPGPAPGPGYHLQTFGERTIWFPDAHPPRSINDPLTPEQQAAIDAKKAEIKNTIDATIDEVKQGRLPKDYRNIVDEHISSMLNDPPSRRVAFTKEPYGGLVCGTVNAKNQFGGYGRPSWFYALFNSQGAFERIEIIDHQHPITNMVIWRLEEDCSFGDGSAM